MKEFTDLDVKPHGCIQGAGSIHCLRSDLITSLLPWQKRGLQETSSGYGSKLTSSWKILYEGKEYRIYITCYSNNGSAWFKIKDRKIFVNAL